MDLDRARKAILANFPSFSIRTIDFLGEGMDSRAYQVNGEYVFRFPMFKEVSRQLEVEACLLPKLQPTLDLTIPQFRFFGREPSSGLAFAGYRKIEGVELTQELLHSLDEQFQRKLIKQVADFLTQVHAFPIDVAKSCGVAANDLRQDYQDDLDAIRSKVRPLIPLDQQPYLRYLEGLYEDYLNDDANFDYTPQLLHSDLSPGHILFDPERLTIVGIIDFGDVNIGNPDYDEFTWMYIDYGSGFIETLLEFLPHPEPDRLFRNLEFFKLSDCVTDILIGLHRNEEDTVRHSLARFVRYAEEFSEGAS
jgi:aminoglycoside 2''-phosphotransferase